jgi:hypothetical protein
MKRFTINLPEGVRPEAVIYAIAGAVANPVACASSAARQAQRDDRRDLTQSDMRTAVEFLRLAMANEIARSNGAASVIASSSTAFVEISGDLPSKGGRYDC